MELPLFGTNSNNNYLTKTEGDHTRKESHLREGKRKLQMIMLNVS